MLSSNEILELKTPPNELLEMHLYQCLEAIRWRYYNNQIDKSTALKLKDRAIKRYDLQVKEYNFMLSVYKECLNRRIKLEDKTTEFRKNPSIELAKEIIEGMI